MFDWNSVKNTPKYSGKVILYWKETEEREEEIAFGYYESGEIGKKGRFLIGSEMNVSECKDEDQPTHWMYTPEPPK